ncbi:MAG: hypothetical protein LQ344_001460 [Seirophora lacunosa]|nr:MAG: hypothetical protein LQ344_001460 [Seirophora lacunosa]
MSSTPVTPRTRSESQDDDSPPLSSPPSSPPSMPPSEDEEKDADYDPKAEAAMRKEEDKLAKESQRRQTKNTKKPAWDAATEQQNYEKLDVFMSKSLGFSGAIMEQLKEALAGRKAETNPQPKLISGGKMRDYQLEGLTWLSCLYEVGLNGILADEMGLGKTVQLISFLAFLREHRTFGPFLILGPLSTVTNWVNEFKRWAPKIPVVMYHGPPQTRTQIRRQQLKGNASGEKFPVVCTSYEICMRDKKYLANYQWKFIVVDEGHRLKNFNCKLVKELKQYPADSRMILTGTPLQNNLTELWSLLNFLLPQAFSDLEQFEAAFNLSDSHDNDGEDTAVLKQTKRKEIINSLHSILKPFLLRRVKADVEHNLPKKREYILYAPLTPLQKEIYRKIKEGNIRTYLEEKAIERISGVSLDARSAGAKRKAPGSGKATPNKSTKSSRDSTPANSIRRTRAKRKKYAEVSDAQFFKNLEDDSSDLSSAPEASDAETNDDSNTEEQNLRAARREVSRKALQNPIMQLRLACNTPHHFHYPFSPSQDPDSTLITASGKMLILDRLLPHLFSLKHKVILFSQFSRQLDFLYEYATVLRGWSVCRIDGGVKAEERAAQIEDFNARPECRLFLLSTRAGGLGINLTAADTVVLFDSDWNPQQDLQAQDRAHRIGQKRPVIVYRLATRGTVEQTLLEKADGKRRLERVVIQKDKFRNFRRNIAGGGGGDVEGGGADEETDEVLQGEGWEDDGEGAWQEGKEVLSQRDLDILTDRSEGAYARAEKGEEDGGGRFRSVDQKAGSSDLLGSIS